MLASVYYELGDKMSSNDAQTVLNSFKRNSLLTNALAISMLIVVTISMAIFALGKNLIPAWMAWFGALISLASMAYRWRKLEYWTFSPSTISLTRALILSIILAIFVVVGILASLDLFYEPHSSIPLALTFPGPRPVLPLLLAMAIYLSLSSYVIFKLVSQMKVPEEGSFSVAVERERRLSTFLTHAFFALPPAVCLVVWFGTA